MAGLPLQMPLKIEHGYIVNINAIAAGVPK